jgi:hypothetical protein
MYQVLISRIVLLSQDFYRQKVRPLSFVLFLHPVVRDGISGIVLPFEIVHKGLRPFMTSRVTPVFDTLCEREGVSTYAEAYVLSLLKVSNLFDKNFHKVFSS